MDRLTKTGPLMSAWFMRDNAPIATLHMTEIETQRVLDRLAAYEDTGLTTEEVQHWKECIATPTMKHLVEMCEKIEAERDRYRTAESEGRLIVLPCKVGDAVWVTSAYFRDFNPPVEAHVIRIEINGENSLVPVQLLLRMDIGNGHKEYGCNLDSIGKIVFLTREEAEAALGRADNG